MPSELPGTTDHTFLPLVPKWYARLLVDRARARKAAKRGGSANMLPLEEELTGLAQPDTDLIAVDEALEHLAKHDPRKAKVVEMRFFGEFSVEDACGLTGFRRNCDARLEVGQGLVSTGTG